MTTRPAVRRAGIELQSVHALPPHEVILLLETQVAAGLSSASARERLSRFGRNELAKAAPSSALRRLARQLNHPLIYVLLVSALVALLLGEVVDASVIAGVVIVNAFVGFIQESRAEGALNALRSMARTTARVRRDGQSQHVPSEELVPGDVVLIEAGDRVPADLRLVELAELRVDESALTGESLPVRKDELALPADTPVADRRNMVYSGTLVSEGSGAGVAVATGEATELGAIHRLVSSAEDLKTPLTEKLGQLSKVLTVGIVALAALTFIVGLARGERPDQMFSAAVALAVGAIPEGLPAAVTVTLAIGMTRMASRRAVIRHLPAVETLGSTTIICSDKTGTLTRNQMTVREIWTFSRRYAVSGSGYDLKGAITGDDLDGSIVSSLDRPADGHGDDALRWTLLVGVACNDAKLIDTTDTPTIMGDPTEAAMLVAGRKAGIDARWVAERFPRVATLTFSSKRQYMATLHDDGGDGRKVFVKGAVERVLQLCNSIEGRSTKEFSADSHLVLAAAEKLARSGLRVLACATASVSLESDLEVDLAGNHLCFVGLQAMLDPPRPEAVDAIGSCHSAGVEVKMITGDHASTAFAIATQMGIIADGSEDQVATGSDLARVLPSEFAAAIERASVFARVSPEQKLRIVEALQSRGHVVAMTGDGVNDAPALRQANIGVAMGRYGTEVAKDAADMVLTDDNFATIEAAIEEGRGVFDNLTKFIAWTLPTNMGEGLVILVAIVLGATLPLNPVQILWINMTTASALGMPLAFEPKEPGIMKRAPRDPKRPILTGELLWQTLLVSALLVGGTAWLFHWERSIGSSIAQARTSALNLFVAVEGLYVFACRSLTQSVWRSGLLSNRWVIVGVLIQAAAQLVITYVPAMNSLFGTAPIGAGAWLRIFGLGVGLTLLLAVTKRVSRTHRAIADTMTP